MCHRTLQNDALRNLSTTTIIFIVHVEHDDPNNGTGISLYTGARSIVINKINLPLNIIPTRKFPLKSEYVFFALLDHTTHFASFDLLRNKTTLHVPNTSFSYFMCRSFKKFIYLRIDRVDRCSNITRYLEKLVLSTPTILQN